MLLLVGVNSVLYATTELKINSLTNTKLLPSFLFSFLIILDNNKVLLSWVIKLLAIILLHRLYLIVKILIFRVSNPIILKFDLSFFNSLITTQSFPTSSLPTTASCSSFWPAFQPFFVSGVADFWTLRFYSTFIQVVALLYLLCFYFSL